MVSSKELLEELLKTYTISPELWFSDPYKDRNSPGGEFISWELPFLLKTTRNALGLKIESRLNILLIEGEVQFPLIPPSCCRPPIWPSSIPEYLLFSRASFGGNQVAAERQESFDAIMKVSSIREKFNQTPIHFYHSFD